MKKFLVLLVTCLLAISSMTMPAMADETIEITLMLPIAAPIFLTVILLVFVQCWNEFFWANVFLQGVNRTVSTKFYDFVGKFSSDMAKVYTAGVISMGPIVVLYAFLQKNFIEGLTSGAVKG